MLSNCKQVMREGIHIRKAKYGDGKYEKNSHAPGESYPDKSM